MSFLSKSELDSIGFKSLGDNVRISSRASIYSPEEIIIGNNVRIDDFCLLSGQITLGSQIHISAYSAMYGREGIVMEDFTGLSPRCTIFSASDDFGGNYLISPMTQEEHNNLIKGPVVIKKYSQIGSNTVILPNCTIFEGVAVGAMSLVRDSLESWSVYAGIPAKKIKDRDKGLLDFVGFYE